MAHIRCPPSPGGDCCDVLDALIERSITEISNGRVTSIGHYAFTHTTSLTTADLPLVTSIGIEAFTHATSLRTINFPLVTTVFGSAFAFTSSLTTADFSRVEQICSKAFWGTGKLTKLIIRTPSVARLIGEAFFANSAIQDGVGYIYVPDNLVAQYKVAPVWSDYASQIRPISQL